MALSTETSSYTNNNTIGLETATISEHLYLSNDHEEQLKASAIDTTNALLDGFFTVSDTESQKLVGSYATGLMIAYRRIDGKPLLDGDKPYFRLRLDNPKKGYKYHTLKGSSNHFYLPPCIERSCGLTWAQVAEDPYIHFYVVEGEKKAYALTLAGFPTVGLSGVWNWKSRGDNEESKPIDDFNLIVWKGRTITYLADSDLGEPLVDSLGKKNVAPVESFCLHLTDVLGAKCKLVRLPNNVDRTKNGIDDLLARCDRKVLLNYLNDCAVHAVCENKKGDKFLNWDFANANPIYYFRRWAALALNKDWAFRENVGFYQWDTTYWRYAESEFKAIIKDFCEANFLTKSDASAFSSYKLNASAALMISENQWDTQGAQAFANATLYFREGCNTPEVFNGHKREDYLTSSLPVEWIPNAKPGAVWFNFLQIFSSDCPKLENYLRAQYRLCLDPTGRKEKYRVAAMPVLWGGSSIGKSTMLEIACKLVGTSGYAQMNLKEMATPEGRNPYIGKRLLVAAELGDFIHDPETLKSLITNEPTTVRMRYKDTLTATIGARLWAATNKLSTTFQGRHVGLPRRMHYIKLGDKALFYDSNLDHKLAKELPGIAQWIFKMSLDEAEDIVRKAPMEVPAIFEGGAAQLMEQSKVLGFIVEKSEELDNSRHPDNRWLSAKTLFESYKLWVDDAAERKISEKKFSAELALLNITKKRTKEGQQYFIPVIDGNYLAGLTRQTAQEVEIEKLSREEISKAIRASKQGGEPQPQPESDTPITQPENPKSKWLDRLNSEKTEIVVPPNQSLEEVVRSHVSDVFTKLGTVEDILEETVIEIKDRDIRLGVDSYENGQRLLAAEKNDEHIQVLKKMYSSCRIGEFEDVKTIGNLF